MIEVVPTFQVVGELRFASRFDTAQLREMTSGADNA